ncbi:MAG TPA: sulfurtransferase-like selenium metabolism protein YedF [Thermodesulfovibrionales bacterium]|nr:sulfurtransferase-like selenium metabolism protein YedF [Thermodesulfovibrionales bacterium]
MIVDAKGLGCPKPVIMAEEALGGIEEGIVEVLVDNEASVKNLTKFAAKNGFYSEAARADGFWRIKIVKGYPCEIPEREHAEKQPEEAVKRTEDELFLVIATDTMGKDEKLGSILMKGLFETMKVYRELPNTIFFLNTGVKLTTVNEETIAILKEFDVMGVLIFTCGTCLDYFKLESELKVGFRGSTTNILEGMRDSKKTVWIG